RFSRDWSSDVCSSDLVRAGYMYAGMTDIVALTGDKSYLQAVEALWGNVVGRKMYLTGGVGSSESGEDFGGNFDLPNATAYNETRSEERRVGKQSRTIR